MRPGRVGAALVFHVRRARRRAGPRGGATAVPRLDESRIWCELAPSTSEAPAARSRRRLSGRMPSRRSAWDAALAPLPPDWTDLLCELEVDSSDYLDRARSARARR